MSHVHPHHDELIHPDGSWKYTNRLVHETSPYLLQHAHNPVDWQPWDAQSLAAAASRDVPIFLSIGYSTCYWCHVMERQVFENAALAELMNRDFLCIKVDREERPDLDDIYMNAVQLMTGRGGWPMSVFLTPPVKDAERDGAGLTPFFAGTYFPPASQHGMPGFGDILSSLAKVWREDRPKVYEHARDISRAMKQHLSPVAAVGDSAAATPLSLEVVARAASRLLHEYEPHYGGFGDAPKFPQPSNLAFLMAVYRNNRSADIWQAVSHTLEKMADGGMCDQIGGGFHRYSTDGMWRVPHFEKMLYDNAQMVQVYLEGQSIQPSKEDATLYERIARETCDYVLREMTDEAGGFYSAQDAEVDAREGGNYLWQKVEVQAATGGGALAELAVGLYGLDQRTNFKDPHDATAPPANVLYLPQSLAKLAAKRGMKLQELVEKKRAIDGALLAVRNQRKQPERDDKVLSGWNGMMIAGMARAARQLNDETYLAAAARAGEFIWNQMRDENGLLRTWRSGRARIGAFLEDHAFVMQGFLELHRAKGNGPWLGRAMKLLAEVEEKFAGNDGGYFDTLNDQADLLVRARSAYDGAVPSGNSQMAHNLMDLFELTGDRAHLDRAAALLNAHAAKLDRLGPAMVHMHHALLRTMSADSKLFTRSGDAAAVAAAAGTGATRAAVTAIVKQVAFDSHSGRGTAAISLNIQEGVHLNAAEMAGKLMGLVATEVRLESSTNGWRITVQYPPGKKRRYVFADEVLSVYEGNVELKISFERAGEVAEKLAGENQPLTLELMYQACTEKECMRPARDKIEILWGER